MTDKTNIEDQEYLKLMPGVNATTLAAEAAAAAAAPEPNKIPFPSTKYPPHKAVIHDHTSGQIASLLENHETYYKDDCYHFLALNDYRVVVYGDKSDRNGQFNFMSPNDRIIIKESSEPGKIEIAHYESYWEEIRTTYTVDTSKLYLRRPGIFALDLNAATELVYVTEQTDTTQIPHYLTLEPSEAAASSVESLPALQSPVETSAYPRLQAAKSKLKGWGRSISSFVQKSRT